MKQFEARVELQPCILKPEDLLELATMVKAGFPKSRREEDFNVSTSFGDVRVEEHSVEKLLEHSGLPGVLRALNMRTVGWSESGDIDKSVEISFYHNHGQLYIWATDDTWGLGKRGQVLEFLARKRPWYWKLHHYFPHLIGTIEGLFGAATIFLFTFGIISNRLLVLPSVFLLIFLIISNLSWRRFQEGRFLPFVSILTKKANYRISIEVMTLIVESIALLVAIISLIILLFQSRHA